MYLLYEINKPYIAAELCENIDKPDLACEGKCFLNKNLQQENNHPKPQLTEDVQKLVYVHLNKFNIENEFAIIRDSKANSKMRKFNFQKE